MTRNEIKHEVYKLHELEIV